jgi:peptidoglycan/xylan/chitin deacetylase (PgdA/CDA1 family)
MSSAVFRTPVGASGLSGWPAIQPALETVAAGRTSPDRIRSLVRRIARSGSSLPPGVYVFAYHGIVDPANLTAWERAFHKGTVSVSHFEEQLAFLSRVMTPLPLSAVSQFAEGRPADRPYFAVTFDDGYTNVLTHAASVVARYGIRPTIFVNGLFAEGTVHYRVLAAILSREGRARELAAELRLRDGLVNWSDQPTELFAQTKNCYRSPGLLEDAVETVYRRFIGNPSTLDVHLTPEGVRELQHSGWEIANHTYAHTPLGILDEWGVSDAIDSNRAYWKERGIPLIDALAYPNGATRDVNRFVGKYLQAHPRVHGFFCNGGVNLHPSRTEWLRLFAGSGPVALLKERLHDQVALTRQAMRGLALSTSI